MPCNDEQYENVCKDEFAGLHEKLDGIDEAIRGNGKPGIQLRLDRLEQEKITRSKVTWFLLGIVASVGGAVLTSLIMGWL